MKKHLYIILAVLIITFLGYYIYYQLKMTKTAARESAQRALFVEVTELLMSILR